MRIVAEEDLRERDNTLRAAIVRYDTDTRERARIVVSIETLQGFTYGDIRLTHQEARAIGHALLTDAARAQKELEG